MSGEVLELDDTTFTEVVNNPDKLVIVEFYTTTCPNCRAMEPVFYDLAVELSDIAVFARINAQAHMSIAMAHGIMGVPAFKFFCQGRTIAEDVGAMHATLLRNTVKDLVRRSSACISGSTPISYEIDGYG